MAQDADWLLTEGNYMSKDAGWLLVEENIWRRTQSGFMWKRDMAKDTEWLLADEKHGGEGRLASCRRNTWRKKRR